MTFDPSQHLIKLKGKDYLEVKWRLVWLREVEPDSRIETECLESTENYASFKATVILTSGASATGHGSEEKKDFGDFYEKAETKAIGRALGAIGFGTQFTDEFEFGADQGRVVDSPVERPAAARQTRQSAPRGQKAPLTEQVQQKSQDNSDGDVKLITPNQIGFAKGLMEERGYDGEARSYLLRVMVKGFTGQENLEQLPRTDATKMIDFIKGGKFEDWAQKQMQEAESEPAPVLDIDDIPF